MSASSFWQGVGWAGAAGVRRGLRTQANNNSELVAIAPKPPPVAASPAPPPVAAVAVATTRAGSAGVGRSEPGLRTHSELVAIAPKPPPVDAVAEAPAPEAPAPEAPAPEAPIKCNARSCLAYYSQSVEERLPCHNPACDRVFHLSCFKAKYGGHKAYMPKLNDGQVVCTKLCYKKLANPPKLTWSTDGKNGPQDPQSSERILLDWLVQPGNYINKWRRGGCKDNNGVVWKKKHLAAQVAALINAAGVRVERDAKQVQNKVMHLEQQLREAYNFETSETGTELAEGDPCSFDAVVTNICPQYYDLVDVFLPTHRARSKPKAKPESLTSSEDDDDSSDRGNDADDSDDSDMNKKTPATKHHGSKDDVDSDRGDDADDSDDTDMNKKTPATKRHADSDDSDMNKKTPATKHHGSEDDVDSDHGDNADDSDDSDMNKKTPARKRHGSEDDVDSDRGDDTDDSDMNKKTPATKRHGDGSIASSTAKKARAGVSILGDDVSKAAAKLAAAKEKLVMARAAKLDREAQQQAATAELHRKRTAVDVQMHLVRQCTKLAEEHPYWSKEQVVRLFPDFAEIIDTLMDK